MTVSNPLAVEREDRLRQALQSRYERADRITSGQHRINVKILRRGETPPGMEDVPGWTDGKTISLNDAVLDVGNLTDSGLIAALGVNLHELAHVMFTPNMLGNLADSVRGHGQIAWHAFNILEDQRAETFFTTKFSDARKFYTKMVFDYLLASDDQWNKNFVLLYGRRYLPYDLVSSLRAKFARKDLVSDFEALIDEYRSLSDPEANVTLTLDIIVRFAHLLRDLNDVDGRSLTPMTSHTADPKTSKSNGPSTTLDKRELRKLAEEAKDEEFPETARDIAEEDEGDDDDDTEDTDGEASTDAETEDGDEGDSPATGEDDSESEDTDGADADDGGDTEGDEDEGESAGGEAEGSDDIKDGVLGDDGEPDDSADGGEDGDDSSDSEGGSDGGGAGAEDGQHDYPAEPMDDDELRDYLQDAADEVANSETVRDEVNETREATRNVLNGVWKPQSPKYADGSLRKMPLTLDRMGHIKSVTRQLQNARVGAETVLKRDVRSGTLNPLALRKAQPGDFNVFDDWDAGLVGEEGEMDVAILCDVSGSMRGIISDAAFSLYAIKRAFEAVGDTNVTAWTFSALSRLLYDRNEHVDMGHFDVPSAGGGTAPRDALVDALSVLGTTQSKLRLLIIVTDGEWNQFGADTYLPERYIQDANAAGVVTVLVGLNYAVRHFGDHGCQISRDLEKPGDLVDVAGDIAAEMIHRAEKNQKR